MIMVLEVLLDSDPEIALQVCGVTERIATPQNAQDHLQASAFQISPISKDLNVNVRIAGAAVEDAWLAHVSRLLPQTTHQTEPKPARQARLSKKKKVAVMSVRYVIQITDRIANAVSVEAFVKKPQVAQGPNIHKAVAKKVSIAILKVRLTVTQMVYVKEENAKQYRMVSAEAQQAVVWNKALAKILEIIATHRKPNYAKEKIVPTAHVKKGQKIPSLPYLIHLRHHATHQQIKMVAKQ